MSVFLDSGYLIGYYSKKDKYNQKALEISKILSDGSAGAQYISDYVFNETINYLMTRTKNVDLAIEFAECISNSQIEIIFIDKAIFQNAMGLFRQRRNLSFTDCTTIEIMKAYEIRSIATFDSGFGQFGKELKILR